MPVLRDFTGRKFGKLLVIYRHGRNGYGVTWMCRCDCGNTKVVAMMNLRDSKTRCCGCDTLLMRSMSVRTHGCSGKFSSAVERRAHNAWTTMRRRCLEPAFVSFKDYGGRGIRVCKRWESFPPFLRDMGLPPTDKHTIERKRNNGNYTPQNCRWATQREQTRNTRANRFLTINGERKIVAQWAEDTGLKYHTLHGRIRRGITGLKLLAPIQ